MSRISLKETYDNRSVIAQIAKVTDTAEDAAETVEQKTAEINDALTDVNAAVQAAEGAVATANAASAAAQQSAQTVAGYNTRLTTAEGEIDTLQSDLNSVTLRVQTAEGQIVTIQGRVTALETADGQNVKINRINDYAVGLTGNQDDIGGLKRFTENIDASNIYHAFCLESSDGTKWYKVAEWNQVNNNILKFEIIIGNYGGNASTLAEGTLWSNGGPFQVTMRGEQYAGAKFKTAIVNGKVSLYLNIGTGRRGSVRYVNGWNYYNGNPFPNNLITYGTGTGESEPTTPTFTSVTDGVVLS